MVGAGEGGTKGKIAGVADLYGGGGGRKRCEGGQRKGY
jgi:hypothetical protein